MQLVKLPIQTFLPLFSESLVFLIFRFSNVNSTQQQNRQFPSPSWRNKVCEPDQTLFQTPSLPGKCCLGIETTNTLSKPRKGLPELGEQVLGEEGVTAEALYRSLVVKLKPTVHAKTTAGNVEHQVTMGSCHFQEVSALAEVWQ